MAQQALIIGGTTGMGKATAELLLKQGIEVVIAGRADKNLETAEKELSAFGSLSTISVDLSKPDEVKTFAYP